MRKRLSAAARRLVRALVRVITRRKAQRCSAGVGAAGFRLRAPIGPQAVRIGGAR